MNQKETPVQFHTNLFEHGLCKYFDVGLWNCSECLHYSDTEPRCIWGYIVHCASLCVYLCPTRYDSTSWRGQRSLINLAHHLLLEANHWRYKGVLYKQSRMCRTQCSQNTSSNPAKSRLQQHSLGGVGICLYCILFIFSLSFIHLSLSLIYIKSRREHVHSQIIMGEIMAYLECLQTGLFFLQGLLLLLLVHPAGWEGEGHPGVGQGRHRIGQSVGSADKNTDPHRSEISLSFL